MSYCPSPGTGAWASGWNMERHGNGFQLLAQSPYVDPLCSDRHPIIIPALSLFICHQTRSNCVAQSRCVIQLLYTAMLFHLNDLSFPSCTAPFPLSSHYRSFCPSLSVYLMPSSRFWLPSCCPLPFSSCLFMWFFCRFTVSITFFQVCLTNRFLSFLGLMYNVSNCIKHLKRFANVRFTRLTKSRQHRKIIVLFTE